LPPQVRQKMEAAFGARFDDVRIHVGPQAQAFGATAVTQGSHIHFAPGQYNPHTHHGQHLLGRELAHVVQQRTGRVRNPAGGGMGVVHDRALEAEADRLAQHAVLQPTLTGILTGAAIGVVGTALGALVAPAVGIGIGTAATAGIVGGLIGQYVTGNGQQPVHAPGPVHVPGPVHLPGPVHVPGPVLLPVLGPNVADIQSEAALAAIQHAAGGTSQSTLALFELANGNCYAIEQETNTRVRDVMVARRVTYLPQARVSGFHAEMRFVKWCRENGVAIAGSTVWVSKPICRDCQDVLTRKGVTMRTSGSTERHYGWLDPDTNQTRTEVDRPVGRYRGHRSEAERLGSDMSNSNYWNS
jgi:hypothetical protein